MLKVCIVLVAALSAVRGDMAEWDYCADGQQTFLSAYGPDNIQGISDHGKKRDVCSDGGNNVAWKDLRDDKVSRPQAWFWPSPHQNWESGFDTDFGKVKKWVSDIMRNLKCVE